MNGNQIKTIWSKGKTATVAWSLIGHPDVSATLARVDVDGVVLDWQHGVSINEHTLVDCIQAICTQPGVVAPLVRVPAADRYQISHVLDAGACGILAPMVSTPEEAERAGRACRYAPFGNRSLGLAPHKRQNESLTEYVKRANNEIICIVMIETKEGVDNIEKICAASGVDGIYIGPYDLSLDMDIPTEDFANHPEHLNVVKQVFKAARKQGIATGHHGFQIEGQSCADHRGRQRACQHRAKKPVQPLSSDHRTILQRQDRRICRRRQDHREPVG